MHLTLTPAYGRDYTSKAAVVRDLVAGKDFILQPDGTPANLESFQGLADGIALKVRYRRMTQVAVLTLAELRKAAADAPRVTMTAFEPWLKAVDRHVFALTGMSYLDFADKDFAGYHAQGLSAYDMAKIVVNDDD